MIELAIGIVAGLISGLLLHFYLNREHDTKVRIKVFDPSDSKKSTDFYTLLENAITKAKQEVIQFAEGFQTDLVERLEFAKAYVEKIRGVLGENQELRWIRIQTKRPIDDQWKDLLQGLVDAYPRQFKLTEFDNRPGDHVLSIVLIDPHLKTSKIFFLISKARNLGGEKRVHVAHTGVMIQGSRSLAEALADRLEEFGNPDSRYVTVIPPTED